jgi:hypothetical protein
MDIGFANSGTDSIDIFLGYGNISFMNQSTYSTGIQPYSIAVGDFNNDTRLDIVVANYGSDNVGIFLGHGNGTFANQMTYSTGLSSSPYSVAVGDFDNDAVVDIVVANYGTNNIYVLLGDFNNDRKLDLAVANNGTDSLYIFLQTC